ncbi:MAG: indolepyruvate oxidoreductase subunit beta [bacterium]
MNILVCGVGGQGILLFSKILAQLALTAGLDVKKSEIHGMAQRGGSVTSHIRWSKSVHSPLIEEGTADIIVALEQLEALRYIHFLAPNGWLIYDPFRIEPLPVQIGQVEKLADDFLSKRINRRTALNRSVPAFATACDLGNPRAQNMVMLGAVSHHLEFPVTLYHQVITLLVKPQFLESNLSAFAAGRDLLNRPQEK